MKKVKLVSLRCVIDREIILSNNVLTCAYDVHEVVKNVFDLYNCDLDREYTLVIGLDVHYKITCINIVSVGSISESITEPREIFKALILSNSSSFIFLHNHPSGYVNPSHVDDNMTRKLVSCGNIMNIKLIDHVIFSSNKYYSYKENEGGSYLD